MGSRGIRVNAVAPGFIDTDMTSVLPAQLKERMLEAIPLGRVGTGDDVARLVEFLAGSGAAYITGQVIAVDGMSIEEGNAKKVVLPAWVPSRL